jgi:YgiT-type zinc finger domain-containing protein
MMQCDFCGAKAAVIKKTTKSFGRGNTLVVIENIPTVHCSRCHESYVTADTARELDRIRKNRRSVGKAKRVLVASFKKSAA